MSKPWATAIVMGLLGLLGLFMASGAQDGVFYVTGLALFVFGVLYIFVIITREVGHPPSHREDEHEAR